MPGLEVLHKAVVAKVVKSEWDPSSQTYQITCELPNQEEVVLPEDQLRRIYNVGSSSFTSQAGPPSASQLGAAKAPRSLPKDRIEKVLQEFPQAHDKVKQVCSEAIPWLQTPRQPWAVCKS